MTYDWIVLAACAHTHTQKVQIITIIPGEPEGVGWEERGDRWVGGEKCASFVDPRFETPLMLNLH